MKNSQTVLCGCPGGNSAKLEASTTLKPSTPITLALESTTAPSSSLLPILHVQEACQFWKLFFMIYSKIASSLVTFKPGLASCTTKGFMAWVWKNERARLKACTASSRSVGWESWFGFMEGGSRVELEVMLTQPLDSGATGEQMIVP